MAGKHTFILAIASLLAACESKEAVQPGEEISLLGSWKFGSHIVSNCKVDADNREDRCSESAAECGVLTLGESIWTWVQALPDGSHETESGTYTISGNYFLLSGGSGPGTKTYSISGSTFSYTNTTLTFLNSSISTGCTHTVTYTRHVQPLTPIG